MPNTSTRAGGFPEATDATSPSESFRRAEPFSGVFASSSAAVHQDVVKIVTVRSPASRVTIAYDVPRERKKSAHLAANRGRAPSPRSDASANE